MLDSRLFETPQFVTSLVRLLKARKREEGAFVLSVVLFYSAYSLHNWLPPEIKEWLDSWHALIIIPVVLFLIGSLCFIYALVKIWPLVHPPKLPPVQNRPSALKGPYAFAPADGDLFRQLGREDELRKLLGFVRDDQVPLVVISGASGVGKTSLLRAGLTNILKDKDIDYHYWEVTPTSSVERLLRAIRLSWSRDSPVKPNGLDELINPGRELCIRNHVIVLDQFEQLRGSLDGPVLTFLRKLALEGEPPHQITWIVAFRRDFRPDWEEFTLPQKELNIHPVEILLHPFTRSQASDVISALISEASLSIEQKVVENLLDALTVGSTVSPVDVGVGLSVLAELSDQSGGQNVTLKDYQFAGGADGLLMQYIRKCTDVFTDGDRQVILESMLALCEPITSQRIAEGLSGTEISKSISVNTAHVNRLLLRISQRDKRLLEVINTQEGADPRYRLAHERLIPALRSMMSDLLAEVERARRIFENGYVIWTNGYRKSRYLLKGPELRVVERHKDQIPWTSDIGEKLVFLRKSQNRRSFWRLSVLAGLVIIVAFSLWGKSQFQRYDATRYLIDNNNPAELVDWQDQLQTLKLKDAVKAQRFPWLHSNSIKGLTLKLSEDTNSLEGLVANLVQCPRLTSLTLDIGKTQIVDLKPLKELQTIKELTLQLGWQPMDLTALTELHALEKLSMEITRADLTYLAVLAKLPAHVHLRIEVTTLLEEVRDLSPLSQVTQLNELSLDKNPNNLSDLTILGKLPNLSTLDLRLIISRQMRAEDLKPLAKLQELKKLKIIFFDNLSEVSGEAVQLPSLAAINQIEEIELTVSGRFEDITPVGSLMGLTRLTIWGLPRTNLPDMRTLANLQRLRYIQVHSNGVDLTPLAEFQQVTHLDLVFRGDPDQKSQDLPNLTPLTKIRTLTTLDIRVSNMRSNLGSLRDLSPATNLSLAFENLIPVEAVPQLRSIPNLKRLSLVLDGNDLKPLAKLNISGLSLDLRDFNGSLMPLSNLRGLSELNLDLKNSKVTDLSALQDLSTCETLSLTLNTAQRMSMKAIPRTLTHLEF